MPHEVEVPLGPLTWYGVGGAAEAVAHPRTADELATLIRVAAERGLPVRVLGDGANLLVESRGVSGVVVRLDADSFKRFHVEHTPDARAHVRVGGGYDLMKLVRETARAGLRGLEGVAGIPASVGGAVRMNAGGAFGDVGSRVERVTLVDFRGEVRRLSRDELTFGYRRSSVPEGVIVEVIFALERGDPGEAVARMKEVFRYKSDSQPMGERSAGCAFKNPAPDADAGGGAAVSAGQMIDRADLKGFRIGAASVSCHHANFITVDKSLEARAAVAAADDVLAVLEHVRRVVQERTGVALDREVVVWPGQGGPGG